MSPQRWQSIQELFHEVADDPKPEQKARLHAACADDPELKAEVEALLAADGQAIPELNGGLRFFAEQLFEDPPDPYMGKTFGPYHLIKLIGSGGMGRVYLAEREDYGGTVALKVLHDALSPDRLELFAAEQKILAQLNHPSIARLYDAGTLPDGVPFFVMEYVSGQTLIEYCRAKHLSMRERLRVFKAICSAVYHLHQHAVIHRDLKPSNILIEADSTVKLLDFGVAESLRVASEPGAENRPRYMTLAYAAPEQIRHEKPTVQADVYALGAILQELLTGEVPFAINNRTLAETRQIILEGQPRKPSEFRRSAADPQGKAYALAKLSAEDWRDLDALCGHCLAKDPAQRYGSVEALVGDVDAFLGGKPLAARRPLTLNYRVRRFSKRNRRQIAVVAAVIALVAGLNVFYLIRLTRARNAALLEAERSQTIKQFTEKLFTGGDEEAGPRDGLKVITLVAIGEKQTRSLRNEPIVQADMFQLIGNVFDSLGHFEHARALLQTALAEHERLFGAHSLEAADTMIALEKVDEDGGEYQEAEQNARQALAIALHRLPPGDIRVANAQFAVGSALMSAGAYKKAIPFYEAALRSRLAAHAKLSDLSVSYGNLAVTYFYLGDDEQARKLQDRALAIDKQLHGEVHPDIAGDYITLANIFERGGHYAEAEQYERQAVSIDSKWFTADHPETADAQLDLAQTLRNEGRYREAGEMAAVALAKLQRAYPKPHERVAQALLALGTTETHLKEYNQAQDHLMLGLQIYKIVYQGKNYRIGTALSDLGLLADAQNNLKAELAYYLQALAMYQATESPYSVDMALIEARIGKVLTAQCKYNEAVPWLEKSTFVYLTRPDPPLASVNTVRHLLSECYRKMGDTRSANTYSNSLTTSNLRSERLRLQQQATTQILSKQTQNR